MAPQVCASSVATDDNGIVRSPAVVFGVLNVPS